MIHTCQLIASAALPEWIERLHHLDQQLIIAVNGSESIFWDNISLCVTNTLAWSLIIIALIAIFFRNNDLRGALLILLAIAVMMVIADQLCSGLVKPLVARWRPTQDPEIMYQIDVLNGYRGGRFGFFSGHACNTMCMAIFLSRLFRFRPITITLILWSITTTLTRIYLGVHYLGDITVGFIAGIIIGLTIYYIYNKVSLRLHTQRRLSSEYTPTGYKKTDMYSLLTLIFFNYIAVVIFAMTLGIQ